MPDSSGLLVRLTVGIDDDLSPGDERLLSGDPVTPVSPHYPWPRAMGAREQAFVANALRHAGTWFTLTLAASGSWCC
jgi:hypothetical protein